MKTVRDGQRVWPYCSECGCRANVIPYADGYVLKHFHGAWSTYSPHIIDARGCRCDTYFDEVTSAVVTYTTGVIYGFQR